MPVCRAQAPLSFDPSCRSSAPDERSSGPLPAARRSRDRSQVKRITFKRLRFIADPIIGKAEIGKRLGFSGSFTGGATQHQRFIKCGECFGLLKEPLGEPADSVEGLRFTHRVFGGAPERQRLLIALERALVSWQRLLTTQLFSFGEAVLCGCSLPISVGCRPQIGDTHLITP